MSPGRVASWGLVVVGLLLSLLLAPLAWVASDVRVVNSTISAQVDAKLKAPGTSMFLGVRPMPLFDSNGRLANLRDADIDTADELREVVMSQADSVGLGEIEGLLERDTDPSEREGAYSPPSKYPFNYTTIDPIVDNLLTPDVIRAEPRGVVDLASILIVAAARKDLSGADIYSGAAVAYSILRRAREVENSCDVQLNLAFLVSLGIDPHIDGTELEFAKAIELCPNDLTPLWWLGQSRLMRALEENDEKRDSRSLLAYADEPFDEIRRRFPTSPLGWAGSADLRLEIAATNDNVGWRYFESRRWRREALDLYQTARQLSDHPGLLAGHARALSALGRHEDAIKLIDQLVRLQPDARVYHVLHANILQAAGRHKEAAGIAGRENLPALPEGLRLAPSTFIAPTSAVLPEHVPFRFGMSRTRGAVVVDANSPHSGGAYTVDLGFLPKHRWGFDGLDTSNGWCKGVVYAVNAIASHQHEELAEVGPNAYQEEDPLCSSYSEAALRSGGMTNGDVTPQALFRMVATSELNESSPRALTASSDEAAAVYDLWQDLWRWAGDLEKAASVAQAWSRNLPKDPVARQRLGEIRFLQGEFESASNLFAEDSGAGSSFERQLQLGTSLELQGHVKEARNVLTRLIERGNAWEDRTDELSAYAHSQRGTLELRAGNLEEAVDDLRASIAALNDGGATPRGSQENNLSIALTKLGRSRPAIATARHSLRLDPDNPVYIDTLAFAENFGDNPSAAIATYRRAVDADPSLFPAWNNMAVLQAKEGHHDEAVAALRRAIQIRPGYAIAWKNLGIVLKGSWSNFLSSQGALARASHHQRSMRGGDAELEFDKRIYESGLDVSKPVAPDWAFATTSREPVNLFTLSMILLLLWRVARTLGFDKVTGALTTRAVGFVPRDVRWLRRLRRKRAPGWTLLMVPAVLAVPIARSDLSVLELVVFAFGAAILAALPVSARQLYSRKSNRAIKHFSWPPGMLLGVLASPLVSFAPPACMQDEQPNSRSRWAGPVALACAGVIFMVMSYFIPAPVVRNLAMAAITVLGSAMIPVDPYEGALISRRSVDIGITAAFTLATIAFTARWI